MNKDLSYIQIISKELSIPASGVKSVLEMLNEGNTIPFIARYRKEATGSLDEVQLRDIRDRYQYLNEMDERRETILSSIEEQGKLNDDLKAKILAANTKQVLEDLYIPFKPKRRTKATIAKEKGLEPLAELIFNKQDFQEWISSFEQPEEPISEEEMLQGARDIIAEWVAEESENRQMIRDLFMQTALLTSEVRKDKAEEKSKFEMYYDFSESVATIPAHRVLAIRRGEEEGFLKVTISVDEAEALQKLLNRYNTPNPGPEQYLSIAIEDSLNRLILPSIEVETRMVLKTRSDDDSIGVFSENMRNLLLAPYGGEKWVLALDPGFRTGTKWTLIDPTGQLIDNGTIFPVEPQNQIHKSEDILESVIRKHQCDFICVGNGTASKEVLGFVKGMLKSRNLSHIQALLVNESGASVYSASDIAREEFPDLDLTYRGSVSIGRRFQDPLAELVKIDPKSIGVGQYQHDVNQTKLKRSLDETVESCVNYVGVNLNTASAPLLSYVAGINKTIAGNIIAYRNENGTFTERKDILKVPRFGAKTFEQAAGFLKITDGTNPLDASAVHPESYPVVKKMAEKLGLTIQEMIGNTQKLQDIKATEMVSDDTGLVTILDILDELKKPGRDPRKEYEGPKVDDSINEIDDLFEGLKLEGTVTNITKFGAFVDIGVHQDGLVHISEMADFFIKDPSEVCAVGDIVKVKVLAVEKDRKRISLSMKQQEGKPVKARTSAKPEPQKKEKKATGDFEQDLASLAAKFKS